MIGHLIRSSKMNEKFEKKMAIWSGKLLDLSKRNRLLNYKPRKTGTVRLDNNIYDFFSSIQTDPLFISNIPEAGSDLSEDEQLIIEKRKKEQLKSLEKIRKDERAHFNEFGFHITYLVFGMIEWQENDQAKSFESPFILVPVEVITEGRNQPYYIHFREDHQIHINPVLIKKFEDDFGLIIKDEWLENSLPEIFQKMSSVLKSTGWTIKETVLLDIFNFQNFVIYKDLETNRQLFADNKFIQLLTEESSERNREFREQYSKTIDLNMQKSSDNLQLLDADSSQLEAILRARRGDSFVLQGPPGTGKSQTITNIIGEALWQGKKVLFVSEKKAALDVVYNKLKAKQLDKFVLTLHDAKQQKSAIIEQIKETVVLPKQLQQVNQESFNQLDQVSSDLNVYSELLNSKDIKSGWTAHELYGKVAKYSDVSYKSFRIPELLLTYNREQVDLLFNDVQLLADSYKDNTRSPLENPWQCLKGKLSLIQKDEVLDLIAKFSDLSITYFGLREELEEYLGSDFNDWSYIDDYKQLKSLHDSKPLDTDWSWYFSYGKVLNDVLELRKVAEREKSFSEEEKRLERANQELEFRITQLFESEVFECANVEKDLKRLNYEFGSPIKRLLSSDYKKLIKSYRLLTKQLKLTYEDLVANLEYLSEYRKNKSELAIIHENSAVCANQADKLRNQLAIVLDNFPKDMPIDNLNEVFDWLESVSNFHRVTQLIRGDKLELFMTSGEDYIAIVDKLSKQFIEFLTQYNSSYRQFKSFFSGEYNHWKDVFSYTAGLDFSDYEALMNYRYQKEKLIETYNLNEFIDVIEESAISRDDIPLIFKKYYYYFLSEYLFKEESFARIRAFSHLEKTNQIRRFVELDKQLMELAQRRLYNYLINQLPDINDHLFHDEKSLLLREFNKKRNFLPTRQLIEKLPNILPLYKPCVMVSPLTVSTYFSSNTDWNFDLVIFDEASQVKIEYAIGSIARAQQLIVAGDSKQMPPTAFFSSGDQNEEELLEDGTDISDLESILDELSAILPETYLDWHYRSQDESLISFSNYKFYNNRLLTFPSERLSENSNVKFTHIEDGIWESRRGNLIEAKKVVEQIIWYADNEPTKSLGVVAFGINQATLIEEELEKFRLLNPRYDAYFDENKADSFFIKNLENVQGDERDIIIISVGYAKQSNGKLTMNFGPLTKTGGERRLNVAVSRARETMHVISSIRGTDISMDGSSNANRQVFRDFLEYVEKGIGALIGYDIDSKERELQFDSDFEENVYQFLTNKGYKVHTQVGASGYKIDLAVVHPKLPGRYVIAVECDGAAYHSSRTARDRDRLRQEILESKGWMFYRIWSPSWLYDRKAEEKRLLESIEQAINSGTKSTSNKFVDQKHSQDVERVMTNLLEPYLGYAKDLPYWGDVDAYYFQNDIPQIALVMLSCAHQFLNKPIEDWYRHINKEVFDKQRLTSGYKTVYKSALDWLVEKGYLTLSGWLISNINRIED